MGVAATPKSSPISSARLARSGTEIRPKFLWAVWGFIADQVWVRKPVAVRRRREANAVGGSSVKGLHRSQITKSLEALTPSLAKEVVSFVPRGATPISAFSD